MSDEHEPFLTITPPGVQSLHLSRWQRFRSDIAESGKAFVRMAIKSRQVREIAVRSNLADARIVVVVVVKDEAPRLPFLLEYYRMLGADHFMIVDNRSADTVCALMRQEADVSLFAADGDFKRARFGTDWVNVLLHRHCAGKWVLWIDADELLVFSKRPDATLGELVAELDRRGQESLATLMIDMYSDRPARENIVASGVDPRTICDLYDRSGYFRHANADIAWIKGGVRGRLFFSDVWAGPALNKTPLVKWRRHYAFLKSAHQLWPRPINGGGRLQGALLHFKFTAMSVEKMVDAAVREQHTVEYEAYDEVSMVSFVDKVTARFVDGGSLVDDGLFEPVV